MVCSETLRFSLDGRDELSLPSHLRHLVDCGEILQTCTMNGADPQLAACVEACEETAEACRALSA